MFQVSSYLAHLGPKIPLGGSSACSVDLVSSKYSSNFLLSITSMAIPAHCASFNVTARDGCASILWPTSCKARPMTCGSVRESIHLRLYFTYLPLVQAVGILSSSSHCSLAVSEHQNPACKAIFDFANSI